jgi:hypothetical protein
MEKSNMEKLNMEKLNKTPLDLTEARLRSIITDATKALEGIASLSSGEALTEHSRRSAYQSIRGGLNRIQVSAKRGIEKLDALMGEKY